MEHGKTIEKITSFKELKAGHKKEIDFLVLGITERDDVNGNAFCNIEATDGKLRIGIKLWRTTKIDSGINEGDVLNAIVHCKSYGDGVSYSIVKFDNLGKEYAEKFVNSPIIPIIDIKKGLYNRVNALREPLRSIAMQLIFKDEVDKFFRWAGGKSVHHAIHGGLAWHSYTMTETAYAIADIYGADKDMVVCGCALHDIGKVDELDCSTIGATSYSIEGQMLGHLVIGVRKIEETATKLGIALDDPDVLALRHIIASHHGELEYGAIKKPMTKEALLVSQIDKMDMLADAWDTATDILEEGATTNGAPMAIGTQAYKPIGWHGNKVGACFICE